MYILLVIYSLVKRMHLELNKIRQPEMTQNEGLAKPGISFCFRTNCFCSFFLWFVYFLQFPDRKQRESPFLPANFHTRAENWMVVDFWRFHQANIDAFTADKKSNLGHLSWHRWTQKRQILLSSSSSACTWKIRGKQTKSQNWKRFISDCSIDLGHDQTLAACNSAHVCMMAMQDCTNLELHALGESSGIWFKI